MLFKYLLYFIGFGLMDKGRHTGFLWMKDYFGYFIDEMHEHKVTLT